MAETSARMRARRPLGSTRVVSTLRCLLAVLMLVAVPSAVVMAEGVPVIAAASDLQFALDEMLADYRRMSGAGVRASYGSSGNFFAQIRQGAPYDIFMSADEALVERLSELALTRDRGRLYAIGRVVLFVPHGSPLSGPVRLDALGPALADGRIRHFAIANPEHAPYGRAAREVLQAAGLWPDIEARLVLGENVAQAAQFTVSGAAQAGIIALSLAMSPGYRSAGDYVVLPAAMHRPLRQRMVLLGRAGPQAAAVYAYLAGPAARAVLTRHGFELPDR